MGFGGAREDPRSGRALRAYADTERLDEVVARPVLEDGLLRIDDRATAPRGYKTHTRAEAGGPRPRVQVPSTRYPTSCRLFELDGASTYVELLETFANAEAARCPDRLRRDDRCDRRGTPVAPLEAAGHRRGHAHPIGGANDELAVPGRWLCR